MDKIPQNTGANITPIEFEQLVCDYLRQAGVGLVQFSVLHNVIEKAYDGDYQIDVKASFEALGANFVVLVECKRHKSPIKREVVQALHDKIRSIGAQKGMIFSTSGFQQGATDYALLHGIALITVMEGRFTYFTKGEEDQAYNPPPWANIPKYVGRFNYEPNHFANLQPGYLESLKEFLQNGLE